MYAVELVPSAAKALAKLQPAGRRRLARRIDQIAEDPRADAVKLRGADDVWRARVGDYRILYLVQDERLIVLIIRIGHRRDVYR
jgi:mRNA interferase RelE/StbE